MPRPPRRARLAPGFHLEEITIKIPLGGIPVAELSGRARTGNPRIDAISRVKIVTTALSEAGHRFIEEMEAQFAGTPPTASPPAKQKIDA